MILPLCVCVVVFAVGPAFRAQYDRHFAPSQVEYARRHGYKYVLVEDYLETDPSLRHPNALSLQRYLLGVQPWVTRECWMVVSMDADILLTAHAPPIHTAIPYAGKIGVVDERAQVPSERHVRVFNLVPRAYYRNYNQSFDIETRSLLNMGLFVFQPSIHGQYLASIYRDCVHGSVNHPNDTLLYEQACVGSRLQRDSMWQPLPNSWNALWLFHREAYREDGPVDSRREVHPKFVDFVRNHYFIHLAGGTDWGCIAFVPHNVLRHGFVDPASADAATVVRQVGVVNAFCLMPGHSTIVETLRDLGHE